MWKLRLGTSLIVGSIVLAVAGTGRAEPGEAEKRAAAQALFEAARGLTGEGKFTEACPKLLESYRLDPAIGTKFYLADCYEHVGKLASAWSCYLEVVDEARQQGAKDREKFALQRAEALKPRLPHLLIKRDPAVRDIAGLAVLRDGLPVGEGMWDTPVPVDLGEHTLRATAPGKKPLEVRVTVSGEGADTVATIPALEALPAPPPAVVEAPPPLPPASPPSGPSGRRIAGFAIGGAGVAALGVGIGMGALAMSKRNASNADGHCNAADVCDATGHQLRGDAIQAATASTALFVVGGSALVAGVVLVVTAPRSDSKSDAAPSAGLSFGPLGASLHGRF